MAGTPLQLVDLHSRPDTEWVADCWLESGVVVAWAAVDVQGLLR